MKMKNKKAEQRSDKQKHRDSLRNQRRSEPILDRHSANLTEKPSILIVCEGKNTEPSYFNQFRLPSARVKTAGVGYNTISLINRAIYLSEQDTYDQVWCVFDKDDFNENDFNKAIQIAQTNNFGVAYSNQAFEYWFILHFDDHQGSGINRQTYNEKINKLLKPFNVKYDGNGTKKVEEDFFDLLNNRIHLAITRAEKNYNQLDHRNPAKEESSTTVFRLVKELLKYL